MLMFVSTPRRALPTLSPFDRVNTVIIPAHSFNAPKGSTYIVTQGRHEGRVV